MDLACTWYDAGSGTSPHPGTSEIHVWQVAASHLPDPLVLSADERHRASRFLSESARTRFVACRTALRKILAGYLAAEPAELQFGYGEHGKPFLEGGGRPDLRFNCSHSGDLGLIAVTRGREIGVDVERIRTDLECISLAERFFATGEVEFLREVAPQDIHRAFFNCWTRKEAWMKAAGVGFSKPTQAFDVSCSLRPRGSDEDAAISLADGWLLFPLEMNPINRGAVVVEGIQPATAVAGGA